MTVTLHMIRFTAEAYLKLMVQLRGLLYNKQFFQELLLMSTDPPLSALTHLDMRGLAHILIDKMVKIYLL